MKYVTVNVSAEHIATALHPPRLQLRRGSRTGGQDVSYREPAPIDMDDLAQLIEQASPSDLLTTLFPDRPYDGQPHTDSGWRGQFKVEGLTFRDLRDCYVRACFLSSGLPAEDYPRSLFDLPWDQMDPLAVWQNMACEIERRMGIFPNLRPELRASIPGEADG